MGSAVLDIADGDRAVHMHRSAIIILETAREHARTACTIGDRLLRTRALRKIAADLTRPWPAGAIRDNAYALQSAIDSVVVRGTPIADLARHLGR